jgi:hypothetical protein
VCTLPLQDCAPALPRSAHAGRCSSDLDGPHLLSKGLQARCGVPVARAPARMDDVMASSILHTGRRLQARRTRICVACAALDMLSGTMTYEWYLLHQDLPVASKS